MRFSTPLTLRTLSPWTESLRLSHVLRRAHGGAIQPNRLQENTMSEEKKQAAVDILQRDSLAILDQQWIRETEAAVRASEEERRGDGWERFLETVAA